MDRKSTKVDPVDAVVVMLAESFRVKPSEAMVEGYRIGLDGLEISKIKAAATTAIRTKKFMPSAAELRELAGEMSIDDRAVLAFDALNRAIDRHHYIKSVDFDDRAINTAINALGGWEAICDTPMAEWHSFFRKRFMETYTAFVRTGRVGESAGAPCVGFLDRENHFNGFESDNLVRIETGLVPKSDPQELTVRGRRPGELPKRIGEIL